MCGVVVVCCSDAARPISGRMAHFRSGQRCSGGLLDTIEKKPPPIPGSGVYRMFNLKSSVLIRLVPNTDDSQLSCQQEIWYIYICHHRFTVPVGLTSESFARVFPCLKFVPYKPREPGLGGCSVLPGYSTGLALLHGAARPIDSPRFCGSRMYADTRVHSLVETH